MNSDSFDNEKKNEKEIKNWDDLDLSDDLLRGIYAYGFEQPSEIQKKTIRHIITGKELIAQAQSGSGKTGAFSIGTLQRIDVTQNNTQALLIAPTHELARQSALVISKLGMMMSGLVVKTVIGGTSIQDDMKSIRKNPPHIIVGSSGRIYDMIKRNCIKTGNIKLLVLDEADELLSKGFKEQIYNIFQTLNQNIQVLLFSATLPNSILELTNKFMNNPLKIIMKKEDLTLECIQQFYIAMLDDNAKYNMLKDLFSLISVSQCIIYCNSVRRVTELYDAMIADGFSVCMIHSSMDKSEREKALHSFRSGSFRVLISSDLTARGIDIQQVSTVINFDIPKCYNTYLHRIGRSGRWGRKGFAINFVTKRDINIIETVKNKMKTSVNMSALLEYMKKDASYK
jgi:translation initiation factor 4A